MQFCWYIWKINKNRENKIWTITNKEISPAKSKNNSFCLNSKNSQFSKNFYQKVSSILRSNLCVWRSDGGRDSSPSTPHIWNMLWDTTLVVWNLAGERLIACLFLVRSVMACVLFVFLSNFWDKFSLFKVK